MNTSSVDPTMLAIIIKWDIFGAKEGRKASILTEKATIFGGIVVITGLKSQAGSHQALNAGSTKRRNQSPFSVAG